MNIENQTNKIVQKLTFALFLELSNNIENSTLEFMNEETQKIGLICIEKSDKKNINCNSVDAIIRNFVNVTSKKDYYTILIRNYEYDIMTFESDTMIYIKLFFA